MASQHFKMRSWACHGDALGTAVTVSRLFYFILIFFNTSSSFSMKAHTSADPLHATATRGGGQQQQCAAIR